MEESKHNDTVCRLLKTEIVGNSTAKEFSGVLTLASFPLERRRALTFVRPSLVGFDCN